jgi:hypothetical protein
VLVLSSSRGRPATFGDHSELYCTSIHIVAWRTSGDSPVRSLRNHGNSRQAVNDMKALHFVGNSAENNPSKRAGRNGPPPGGPRAVRQVEFRHTVDAERSSSLAAHAALGAASHAINGGPTATIGSACRRGSAKFGGLRGSAEPHLRGPTHRERHHPVCAAPAAPDRGAATPATSPSMRICGARDTCGIERLNSSKQEPTLPQKNCECAYRLGR